MARNINSRVVTEVIINNGDANKALDELKNRYKSLSAARDRMLKSGNYKKAEFSALEKEIKSTEKRMHSLEKKSIDVDRVMRNINRVSLNDLHKASRKLRAELAGMDRDSTQYYDTLTKIKRVEREIASTRAESKVPQWLQNFSLASAALLGINKLKQWGTQAIEVFKELDDKYSDVMKTTGMTKDEVVALDAELMKIDTRTSRLELLDLAAVAGKLGIAKEDVEGFVRAADKINVALSEDLGGNAEEAIRQIGKLVDIFHLKETLGIEKAMLSVGSAINTLGASSTANEGFIVDFATDLAGTAPAADIAIESVLGYASTLDSLGQRSKKSATAVSKAIRGMFTDTAKYAKIAGMELPNFKKLLEEDANEAFLKFLEGANSDLGSMAKSFESVGLTGTEAQQVLGALAGNIQSIREQQTIANVEFEVANSIQEEFNTKNTSAQAIADKRQKEMQAEAATLGQKLLPLWIQGQSLLTLGMKGVGDFIGLLIKYRAAIIAMTIAYGAYIVLKKLEKFYSKTNIQDLKNYTKEIRNEAGELVKVTAKTHLFAAAKLLLAGQFKAAAVAAKGFFAALGPIGWIAGAVGLVVGAFTALDNAVFGAKKQTQEFTEVNAEASKNISEEKIKLNELLRVAADKNRSDADRLAATKALQKIIPNGIELINDETIANGQAKIAVDEYIKSLLLRAKVTAIQDKLVDIEKKRIDLDKDTKPDWISRVGSAFTAVGDAAMYDMNIADAYEAKVNSLWAANRAKREAELNAAEADLQAYLDTVNADLAAMGISPTFMLDGKTGTGTGGGGGDDDKTKWSLEKDKGFLTARAELRRQLTAGELANETEYNDKVLQLEIDTFKARMKLLGEGHEDYAKLNADLNDKLYQQQKNETTRTEKLLQASFEGAGKQDINLLFDKEKAAYEKRLKELGLFGKKREDMTDVELAAALALEKQYNQNLSRIYAEGMQDRWNEMKTQFEDEQAFLRERNTDELSAADTLEKKKTLIAKYYGDDRAAQVKTNAQALKLLNEYYRRTEAKQQAIQLEQLLAEYQKQMDELVNIRESTGGLLPELNEDEVKRLQAIIRKLKEDLAKLNGQAMGDEEFAEDGKEESKLDFLGYSKEDWTEFFKNLDTGWDKLDKWKMAVELISNAWGEVNNLMKAVGEREIANLEKTSEKKKKALDEQLQQGIISQETYNQRVQELDEETDTRKKEILRQQAIREKALAIFSAVINTALGVVEAAPVVPLMIAIGALGALQIAAIAAQPLPQLADGGALVDVLGSDDKKRYRAKYAPKKRGWVKEPTVLTGENGSEYVIPHSAMGNPTIRPVIDILEMARRSGSLSTINLPAIYEAEQYARGGFVSTPTRSTAPTADVSTTAAPSATGYDFSRIEAQLSENREVNARLLAAIERGIFARVDYYGRGGIKEVTDRATRIENSATIKPRTRTKTK